jgi:hypothetical protein
MKDRLLTLVLGIFNFNQHNYVIDERGGYWVKDLTGKYILGYNYITGYYAGHYIRFSQMIGIEFLNTLEKRLDERIPDITKNWRFNPEIIKDEELEYSKCDMVIVEK